MAKTSYTSASLDASEASWTNGMSYYGLTIKATGLADYCSQERLDNILDTIIKQNKRYQFKEHIVTYELDSKHRLHMHAYIEGKPRAWIKPIKGFHVHVVALANQFDCIRWQSYIKKEAHNQFIQEEILLRNEAMNKNMFEFMN